MTLVTDAHEEIYAICTTLISQGGGDVMVVDDSTVTSGTGYDIIVVPYNEQGASDTVDHVIIGIASTGTIGKDKLNMVIGRPVGMITHGVANVLLADDADAVTPGYYMVAEVDPSQVTKNTYGETQGASGDYDRGAMDVRAAHTYTTAAGVTGEQVQQAEHLRAKYIGIALQGRDATPGDDVKIKVLLRLQAYFETTI